MKARELGKCQAVVVFLILVKKAVKGAKTAKWPQVTQRMGEINRLKLAGYPPLI